MHHGLIFKCKAFVFLVLIFSVFIFMQRIFYLFIKVWVRLSLLIFCKKIVFHNPGQLRAKGPLLIAAHHPNSFFDAILIGAFMQQPVHFITRGDVFNKKWARAILRQLNMMPIYRIRDGKEKLSLNQQTFNQSVEVLKNNGIVLIFVEGLCEHQTTLLPLKKGAPRIVLSCWQQGIPAHVLPVWLRYHSFTQFGKNIEISFGQMFGESLTNGITNDGAIINQINQETHSQLAQLYLIQHFFSNIGNTRRYLLAIPALLGWLLHAPLYMPVRAIIWPLTRKDIHFDSVMFGVLTFVYPFYAGMMALTISYFTTGYYGIFALLVMPLLARCYTVYKK
jgi:1-acyl-sn-glycerol-3-phosphate acyltransferase